MDCPEIRDAFRAGAVPAGPEVDEHLRGCGSCRELFRDGAELGRALARDDTAAGADSAELWASLEQVLATESGPRAWLRSRATRDRVLLAVIGAVMLVALGLHPLRDLGDYAGVPSAWLALFAVGLLVCLGLFLAPLGQPLLEPRARLGLTVLCLVLPLGYAWSSEAPLNLGAAAAGGSEFFRHAFACFRYGLLFAAPFLVLLWALERRDRSGLSLVLVAGSAAGLVANAALLLHCPNTEPGHLALGHATISAAVALVAVLAVASRRVARS